jgi:RNA polymerase sigma-70 factor (ECF subfamily)
MDKKQHTDPEVELLNKIVSGDEEAFKQLYERISDGLFFFLVRLLHNRDLAEDIQVETFTEVWRCAKDFKGKSQVKTWIFGIARNLALNELRKKKKQISTDDFSYPADSNPSNSKLIDKDKHVMIRNGLSKISAKHQEILDLVFFHEMNYREVSEVLNISINTVKTRVFYAKEALSKVLKRMGMSKNDIST